LVAVAVVATLLSARVAVAEGFSLASLNPFSKSHSKSQPRPAAQKKSQSRLDLFAPIQRLGTNSKNFAQSTVKLLNPMNLVPFTQQSTPSRPKPPTGKKKSLIPIFGSGEREHPSETVEDFLEARRVPF